MDEDNPADRYLYLSIGLGAAALAIWVGFILNTDAKVYLAAGVVTTVASAMFRVLAELRAVAQRVERLETGRPAPDPGR
ncbi:MAG: hypothetical protein ACXWDL_15145 [Nocardioides sp.]